MKRPARIKMIQLQWKILRWILAGGAFLSVLNTSGCTMADKSAYSRDSSGVPTVAAVGTTNIAMSADPTVLSAGSFNSVDTPAAPAVNVYGEFDGMHAPLHQGAWQRRVRGTHLSR